MELLQTIYQAVVTYGPTVLAAIGAFAVIAVKLPKPDNDSMLLPIYEALQYAAMNWGNAKNVR